jgi:hypothetical protein
MYYLELFDRRCRDFRYRYKFSTLELSVLSYVLRPHRVVVGRGVSSFKIRGVSSFKIRGVSSFKNPFEAEGSS